MPLRIVLASSSPYRRRLLERLGLPFDVDPANIDETPRPDEPAEALVRRLSEAKAMEVAPRNPGSLVIASDQTGVLDGQLLSKPGTPDRARAQLRAASGKEVRFLTGLCVLDTTTGARRIGIEACSVMFRELSQTTIEDYVEREQPLDCAGSFKIEGLGIALFRSLRLNDPTALEGLPLILLCNHLQDLGAPVLRR
jgi:MAF protein